MALRTSKRWRSDLVGGESGTGDLLLIVASSGDLPDVEALEGDSRSALESVLAAEGRRLIYPIEIEIVEPVPAPSE